MSKNENNENENARSLAFSFFFFYYFRFWTVDLGRSVMLRLFFFSHGLAMFPLADSLAIVAKFTQQ